MKETIAELRRDGTIGLDFKVLPYVDQQQMYRLVYDSLKHGGSIGIFPEGAIQPRNFLSKILTLFYRW